MATALPREMWEVIVSQLPPPRPKLVPMICIALDWADDTGRIWISKAVSQKEAFMIFDVRTFEGLGEHRESGNIWWGMDFVDDSEDRAYFSRARMLGWDYATDSDRAAREARKDYYMTRAL